MRARIAYMALGLLACGDPQSSPGPVEPRCEAPLIESASPLEPRLDVTAGESRSFSISILPTGFGEKHFMFAWRRNGQPVSREQIFYYQAGAAGVDELSVQAWECDDGLDVAELDACFAGPPYPEGVTGRTWIVKVEP